MSRNRTQHSFVTVRLTFRPKTVNHIKAKYEHFKSEIKTPEDFIHLSARKSLLTSHPYLVRTADGKEMPLDAWLTAALVPGENIDQKLVRSASRRHWPELLNAGIKIYEYQPTMLHAKLMIVDDKFVSVGSGNFDNRSIRLNDEANLNVLDSDFAAQQAHLFEIDKRRSHEVTANEVNGFHLGNPFEPAASLLSPQL
jgi:phosphatidylserine/phosphatidylglycerophosphate/cardiolipin synthase-like enzyme